MEFAAIVTLDQYYYLGNGVSWRTFTDDKVVERKPHSLTWMYNVHAFFFDKHKGPSES